MTKVKLCGLMSQSDVVEATLAGADYLGFVLAPSKRRVQKYEVRRWLDLAQQQTGINKEAVLVLVGASREEILHLVEETGVRHVQLCGQEQPDLCRELRTQEEITVWKAWQVFGDDRDKQLSLYAKDVDALLLDTYKPGITGGSGETFAWHQIDRLQSYLETTPIAVAGGLTPYNVAELLEHHAVDVVDVSSGIEKNGHKDAYKMQCFIQEVRRVSHDS